MAATIQYLQPVGVGSVNAGSINSGSINTTDYGGTSGDQGHGWRGTFSYTNTVWTALKPVISLPSNARALNVTFWYNGAATVTVHVTSCNDTLDAVVAETAIFGKYINAALPSLVGGSSGSTAVSASLAAAPLFLKFDLSGSGSSGTDVIGITVSCVTVIRP